MNYYGDNNIRVKLTTKRRTYYRTYRTYRRINIKKGRGVFDNEYNCYYETFSYKGRYTLKIDVYIERMDMTEEMVEDFDRRHDEFLSKEFPDDPLVIPHRVFIIHGRTGGQQDTGGNA